MFQFMMKLRKLTSDRNVVTFITVPRTLESALCQFSDSQFKMSNFVVNQSHFKSIYDGIIDLTKMVQGNDSFFLIFLAISKVDGLPKLTVQKIKIQNWTVISAEIGRSSGIYSSERPFTLMN